MSKKTMIVIGIIAVVVILGGGYAIIHALAANTTSSSYGTAASPASGSKSTAAAVNNAVLTTKNSSNLGEYLTDSSGNALYTYGADTNSVSNCSSSCLTSWPAYQDAGATTGLPANIGTIKRSDNGQMQYTYKGRPLYTFVGDANGQVSGNGVSNFTVAKP